MLKIAAFLLMIGTAPIALSAEWLEVSSNKKMKTYVDRTSIAMVDGYWRAWMLAEYADKQKATGSDTPAFYVRQKYLAYYDCKPKRMLSSSAYFYDDEGAVVQSFESKFSPKEFTDVVPETVGDDALTRICAYIAKSGERKAKK